MSESNVLFSWVALLLVVSVILVRLFVVSFREGARPDWSTLVVLGLCDVLVVWQIIKFLGR